MKGVCNRKVVGLISVLTYRECAFVEAALGSIARIFTENSFPAMLVSLVIS